MKHEQNATSDHIDVERLNGCARCDGDGHDNLRFERLDYPITTLTGDFTHWTPCPTNGQPILLVVTDEDEDLPEDIEAAEEAVARIHQWTQENVQED